MNDQGERNLNRMLVASFIVFVLVSIFAGLGVGITAVICLWLAVMVGSVVLGAVIDGVRSLAGQRRDR